MVGSAWGIWRWICPKLGDIAKIRERDGPSDFLDIASTFRYRLATDPRDKVFGLLGLTNDLTRETIDYDRCVAEIYSTCTLELIAKTGNLDVLSHVIPAASNTRRRSTKQAHVAHNHRHGPLARLSIGEGNTGAY